MVFLEESFNGTQKQCLILNTRSLFSLAQFWKELAALVFCTLVAYIGSDVAWQGVRQTIQFTLF
jgi:hypothetical protein